jgi:hypothetical protein
MDLPALKAGIYRHYKGPLYLALGYGHDSNDDSRIVVVYVPLYTDPAHSGPALAVRTAMSDDPTKSAWWDFVHPDSGTKCCALIEGCEAICDGLEPVMPRYEYLGPFGESDN